jgi:magnesium chelatase family protein
MGAQVQSIIYTGSKGVIVDIECHLSNNLPNIVIVGFANRAVDEARERIRGAFATSRIVLPRKRITLNLAPADIPKADSGFDLAMAVAILAADNQVHANLSKRMAFIGELGLDGTTRAVRGIIGKLLAGRAQGINTFYIPDANLAQARLVPNVTLIPVNNLEQLYSHLNLGTDMSTTVVGKNSIYPNHELSQVSGLQPSEVIGQDDAKRALSIAAAGGHNIFFTGPPGTGKSMLAKALQNIMPPLNTEEILEVTQLHSLANHDYEQIISERPFRAPHHSASFVAITGGGPRLQPGEISLAHRGVLFLDELPEYDRDTIETLRQPLEDRQISIRRIHGNADYPANFILVATANPCPCGYAGYGKHCSCTKYEIERYQNRLSGPILDRIDLQAEVGQVNHDKLLTQEPDPSSDATLRANIRKARSIQAQRYKQPSKLNADMSNVDIKTYSQLTQSAISTLNDAARHMNFSARAYMRTIKVARTVADLGGSPKIKALHISEAIRYRPSPKHKDT